MNHPSGPTLRIEYTLTYRDWLLFNLTHQFLSPVVQIFYVAPAVLFYFIFSLDEDLSPAAGAAAGAAAAIKAYLLMWLIQIVFTAIYGLSGKNRSLLTRHVVELQDDAFYNETAYARSYNYWPGINKVVLRPGFAAVYTSAHVAHIIPRRAFASDEQVWQFVATVRDRLRGKRN